MIRQTIFVRLATVGVAVLLAACTTGEASLPATADREAADAGPALTGTVIEVKMVTDGAGNYFDPKDITARRGDVVRFVLVTGVHNVSFPADLNDGPSDLPEASPYLQLPGQTWDLTVAMPTGVYEYQCDPHAALGMVGTLEVVN